MRANGTPAVRNRPGRVTVTCKGCGTEFDSIRSQIERRNGGKFHSRDCWKAWRERTKQTRLEKLLKALYAMTLADYTALLEAQGGVCGICRRSAAEAGRLRQSGIWPSSRMAQPRTRMAL